MDARPNAHGTLTCGLQFLCQATSAPYQIDDVVIVSQHGYGNTRLAGGDQDGDLNMIHWNETLIRIIEGTEEAVQGVDVSAHDHEVEEEAKAIVENPTEAMLHFRRTLEEPFKVSTKQRRQALYVEYCLAIPTPRIRSRCCAMAGRVFHRAG